MSRRIRPPVQPSLIEQIEELAHKGKKETRKN